MLLEKYYSMKKKWSLQSRNVTFLESKKKESQSRHTDLLYYYELPHDNCANKFHVLNVVIRLI